MPRRKNRRGRPSAIAKLSVSQLMSEIERRRGMAGELHARRADIEGQLAILNTEIAGIEAFGAMNGAVSQHGPGRPKASSNGAAKGGRHGNSGRGRGGNEKSLASRLHQLLRGRTMSVPEMAEAVKKAGHKSKSKNFNTVVGLALLSHKKMFKRVSRGQYTAK